MRTKIQQIVLLLMVTLVGSAFLTSNALAKADFKKDWDDAKKYFEKKLGKKKPSKKILGIRKGSGIDKALKKLDKAEMKATQDRKPKSIKAYNKAYKNFNKKATKYLTQLKDAGGDEDDVGIRTGLKFLRKTLKQIRHTALAIKKDFESGADRMEGAKKSAFAMMKAKYKKATAFVAKIETKMDIKQFNKEIEKIGRGLITSLRMVQTLKLKGVKDPQKVMDGIKRWGDGWKSSNVKKPEQLSRELWSFKKKLKTVKAYIKKNE